MKQDSENAETNGWLFGDRDEPRAPAPRRRITVDFRSPYFWMNVGFYLVLAGLVLGASSQPWFLIVAVAWVAIGVFVITKNRRHQPPPPNLFDDRT